jgi:hypothetical protein
MRVACVVLFATSLSLSPMFPLGLDGEDGHHHAEAASTSQTGFVHAVQEAIRPFLEADAEWRAGYCLDPCYALDVWGWRDSPHGTFVNFNPNVSCDGLVPTS